MNGVIVTNLKWMEITIGDMKNIPGIFIITTILIDGMKIIKARKMDHD